METLIFMLLAKHGEIDYEVVIKLAEVIDFGWCQFSIDYRGFLI